MKNSHRRLRYSAVLFDAEALNGFHEIYHALKIARGRRQNENRPEDNLNLWFCLE